MIRYVLHFDNVPGTRAVKVTREADRDAYMIVRREAERVRDDHGWRVVRVERHDGAQRHPDWRWAVPRRTQVVIASEPSPMDCGPEMWPHT